jgi:hypothetical protein
VRLDDDGRVTAIEVKAESPATDWIWGCLAARAGALRGIGAAEWPSTHVAALAHHAPVVGVRLSTSYLDVGTRAALATAEAWVARHELVA